MNICIIGGSGFIGTHLIGLLKEQHEITIIDKQPSEAFRELVIRGDIRDRKFLFENLKGFDQAIHLAAEHKDNVSPVSLDGTQRAQRIEHGEHGKGISYSFKSLSIPCVKNVSNGRFWRRKLRECV